MTSRITPDEIGNPTALGLAVASLQSDMAMLQRETSSNVQNLTSAVQAVQAESRHVIAQLAEVKQLQERQLAHSEGLDRAFRAIEKLATSFEGWRDAHEVKNQVTSDAVTEFRGALRATQWSFGLLGGMLITIGALWMQDRLADLHKAVDDGKLERSQVEARRRTEHDRDVARLQEQITRQAARLEQVQHTGSAR